jgi:tetratricopeptide (TPR) repeat protein
MKRVGYLLNFGLIATLLSSADFAFAQTVIATPPAVVTPEKLGNWRRAETEHFIFYSDGGEKDLRADAIKLERFDKLMRLLLKIDADDGQMKLTVYFVSTASRVQSLYGGTSKNIAGFYSTNPAGVLAVVPRSADAYGNGDSQFASFEDVILFHEYAHHLMMQNYPAAYPAWYIEGFAEFIGNARVDRKGMIKYGIANISRAPSLFLSSQLPIEKLLTAKVTDLKGEDLGNLYARGWALTHYLSFEPSRKDQLGKYLTAVGKGRPSLDAAREAFGDLKQLNRAIDRYVQGSMKLVQLANAFPEPKPFSVAQLTEGESDAVIPQIKLARGTAPKEREGIAQNLRQLAVRHPGNTIVAGSLAEAELDLGNYAASGLAADVALKIDPQNSRALLWKGLSIMRPLARARDRDAAKWKVARSWIVKANRANLNDPLALFEYYMSYVQAGLPAPDIAVQGLAGAVARVPQEPILRFAYASALGRQKKYDEAVEILGIVANNPHGGGASAVAEKMIAALLMAKGSPTAPTIDLDSLASEGGKQTD